MQQAQPSTQQVFTKDFVFPGDSTAMIAARDAMLHFLGTHGIGDEEEIDIMIALQEALANAVLHGCGGDPASQFTAPWQSIPRRFASWSAIPVRGSTHRRGATKRKWHRPYRAWPGHPADAQPDGRGQLPSRRHRGTPEEITALVEPALSPRQTEELRQRRHLTFGVTPSHFPCDRSALSRRQPAAS